MTELTQTAYPPHTLRAAVAKGQMNRRAWLITGMLVIFQMINFADKAVLGLVAEPAMGELGLSASEFGFIGSAFFFLFAISAVCVGFLAAKVPTRWILLTMGVLWSVLQFPMLFGGGAAILLVTRIVLGAAEGPATPTTLHHVHGWFPARERGLPSTLVAIGSTLGPIIAAPILAYIIAHPQWGWRWAFGFLGLIGFIWSVLWLVVAKEGPYSHLKGKQQDHAPGAQPAQDQAPASERASITEKSDTLAQVPIVRVFCSRMFIIATLAGAGCFWAQGFLTTWSPRYLGAVVSLSPEMVGLVSTFPWLFGALTLGVLGYASRVMMRRGVSVYLSLGASFGLVLLLSGVCFLVLPHLQGYSAVTMLVVAAGLAMTFPLAPTAVAFCVASRQRGAVMATLTAVASLGGIVAPVMVGLLMERAGYLQVGKGAPQSLEMTARLAEGMNASFAYIGCYLVVMGFVSILCLDPDSTAKKLQKRFA
ncbi:MFS transporter [Pseudomonas sp. CM25]|nr:MFS transporter [Pseudomonas sp. CM25]NQD74954.1 MFS transporter [Pseudomonas sp. CM27]HEN8797498.1 MFS transporter [Pseudomonas putida]